MTDKLRQGDRVRSEDGRTGVLNGIFAEVAAWGRGITTGPATRILKSSRRWCAPQNVRPHQSRSVNQARRMLKSVPAIRDHNGRGRECP